MGKLKEVATGLASKTKATVGHLANDASNVAKGMADNANEKRVIKQAEKRRAGAKNAALLALNDVSKDLESYNKNLTPSETVKSATDAIIDDIKKMKDMINQMTPETVVPILEDQKTQWLDEKSVNVEGDNYAQLELDKSEIIRRRHMAAKKCEKAIEALRKQAEKEG